MEQPKQEYESSLKHYLITDSDNNITNVSEGLYYELGLNSKFFQYTDSIFQQMIDFQKICPNALDPAINSEIEGEGLMMEFDTSQILDQIELEQLTSDEILEVQGSL